MIELLEVMGSDLTVSNSARVSFGKQSTELAEKDARLIRYLAAHGHWSPFSHPQASFRIRMPIFLARQWWRHTVGFSRNETSRRYVDDQPTFWRPGEWRGRAETAKQGSGEALGTADQAWCFDTFDAAVELAEEAYRRLLGRGVCPEQARAVLPVCLETEWVETASLYGYARLLRLRLAEDAQRDLRPWAEGVRAALLPHFPVSLAALLGEGAQ